MFLCSLAFQKESERVFLLVFVVVSLADMLDVRCLLGSVTNQEFITKEKEKAEELSYSTSTRTVLTIKWYPRQRSAKASDHELRAKKSFKLRENYITSQRNYTNVNKHECRECKLKLLTNIAVRLSSKAHHL